MPVPSRSYSIRSWALIIAPALVGIIVLSCIFSNLVDTPYVIYAFSVLSGNWGGNKPIGVDENTYIVGAIIAVILNALTVSAIVKGAIELTLIRKDRKMTPRNAFNVRDQLALKNIMTQLEPLTSSMSKEEANGMKDKLWECFIAADKKWQAEFIPLVMPGPQGRDFLDKINSGPK